MLDWVLLGFGLNIGLCIVVGLGCGDGLVVLGAPALGLLRRMIDIDVLLVVFLTCLVVKVFNLPSLPIMHYAYSRVEVGLYIENVYTFTLPTLISIPEEQVWKSLLEIIR